MVKLTPIFKGQKNKAAARAAFAGDFETAFSWIGKGAEINSSAYIGDPDEDGGEGNIGYAAIKHGNLQALEKALDMGLDPSFQSPYRSPLVIFAIQNKQEDAAKLLIARGADVSSYLLGDFFSPLATARVYNMPDVEALIAQKLTPDQLATARANDLPQIGGAPKNSKPNGLKL